MICYLLLISNHKQEFIHIMINYYGLKFWPRKNLFIEIDLLTNPGHF